MYRSICLILCLIYGGAYAMSPVIAPEILAAITIWQESAGETYEAKVAVATVIHNRMKLKYQSDGSVAGTVLKSFQFSGWNTRSSRRIPSMYLLEGDKSYLTCLSAWREAVNSDVTNMVLYHQKDIKKLPYWSRHKEVRQVMIIGNHVFYEDNNA